MLTKQTFTVCIIGWAIPLTKLARWYFWRLWEPLWAVWLSPADSVEAAVAKQRWAGQAVNLLQATKGLAHRPSDTTSKKTPVSNELLAFTDTGLACPAVSSVLLWECLNELCGWFSLEMDTIRPPTKSNDWHPLVEVWSVCILVCMSVCWSF